MPNCIVIARLTEFDEPLFLLQATEIGSSARDLVESFPPSGANYNKAIQQLKSCFAKDELLIQIYVRELLNLVLMQAKNGENFTLRALYHRLENQLRTLQTLRVTSEKYEAMLYPLVESALPEDLIKALKENMWCYSSYLTELWSPDAIGIRDPVEIKSSQVADEETVEFFRKTIKRNEDKRYEVCLPWKSVYPELEINKEVATKRLMSTTKNLIQYIYILSEYLSEYDDVFNEWIREGIIEFVDDDKNKGHYLPHHPAIKTGDTTTKIRPVFDASAKDSKGNCLNNCLEKGPNLLELVYQN
ncbi:uncharacterized protein LOC129971763 [Argiope bruennichi]|uniref:uncharacterized protein LOC129971763 n=1 Tax=Argiope bruennichi TaxID=94029 RepID=UPI0024947331|nr:uncharacterized protein LOC129971763 [Argiope bruennichi]